MLPFPLPAMDVCCGRFGGFRVYLDGWLTDRHQIRFPRSKKKRIRRKWAKRPQNWVTVPRLEVYRVGDRLIMHPWVWHLIQRELEGGTDGQVPPARGPGASG